MGSNCYINTGVRDLEVASDLSGRKISKGPRTIMLKIYVGSARDLSAKNNQNTKTARLILRKKIDETAVHGSNPTLSVSVVLVSRKVNFFT